MTDYDHWPPIKFRFFGDEDQAKGRIPQARSLMAQLIRRMEGFERDNGQWQVQAEDGTQFRVMKMGDVHVADIVGVSPSVERPRPIRDITPAPEIAQREILMRPHGERFEEGTGDYLWVGVEVDYSFFTEDDYATINKLYSKKTNTRYIHDITDPSKWQPQEIGKDEEFSAEFYDVAILPQVNLMLFEPGWNSAESTATVMQSAAVVNDGSYTLIGNADLNKPGAPMLCTDYTAAYATWSPVRRESYSIKLQLAGPTEGFYYWPNFACPSLTTPEPDEIPQFLCERVDDTTTAEWEFVQRFWQAPSGSFTAYPYMDAGGYGKRIDSFVTVDANNTTQTITNCIDTNYVGPDGYINQDGYAGQGVYVTHNRSWNAGDNITSFRAAFKGKENIFTYKFIEYNRAEDDKSVDFKDDRLEYFEDLVFDAKTAGLDFSHDISPEIKQGVYELRLAAGAETGSPYYQRESVKCKVYIQTDRAASPTTYEIEVPRIGASDSIAFNTAGWINDKTTTLVTDSWYPGCWLIDIANKTVIHETSPANLTRDWFTTE